jgi:CubicO group peptidase (beta-lactamase class C family)
MNRRDFVKSASVASAAFSWSAAFAAGPSSGAGIEPPPEAFLSTLPQLMELADLPGIGMGVVRPGHSLWEHYLGVANSDTKAPITPNSLFPGCSLGKPIFACLVLRLSEQGKIGLDRPLNQYLRDDALTGEFGDRVTARHVLSHSTGLYNWRWEKGQKLTPTFAPGSKFRYSGEGFYHLQRVVEHILGSGFESLIQDTILQPLGMTSTTYLWRDDANDRLVAGHNGGDPMYNRNLAIKLWGLIRAANQPLSFWTHEQIVAALTKDGSAAPEANEIVPNVAFSLLTTVGDYARFLTAFVDPGNEVLGLSPATRAAMQAPVSHVNSALAWGLGIGIEQAGGNKYLWQWGDNGGWKNFQLEQPATRSAIVVFTNGHNGAHVNERILRAATGIDHPAFLWI